MQLLALVAINGKRVAARTILCLINFNAKL